MLFSFGHYHVHTVFMAFLSFTGLTAIFKLFSPFLKNKKNWLVFAVFLVPSVLFWTSGVLKEGLVMFSLGLLLYNLNIVLFKKYSVVRSIVVVLLILLLILSKFYILIATLPGIIALFWYRLSQKHFILKFVAVHIICAVLAFNSHYFYGGINFADIISYKQNDFINYVQSLSDVGSYIELDRLEPDIISLLRNTPQAMYNSFFRPHLLEVHSPVALVSALENMAISIIIILILLFYDRRGVSSKPMFMFCVSFWVILFLLSGLTTPVLGALVRYKTPALPFLFIMYLFLLDTSRIEKYIMKLLKR